MKRFFPIDLKGVSMELKIDIDNHKFQRWIGWFEWSYTQLRFAGVKLKSARVYRTLHGYHVYFGSNLLSRNEIVLVECFLGSDIKKQVYAFVEGNDILFARKNWHLEKYDAARTKKLAMAVALVNRGKYVAKTVVV